MNLAILFDQKHSIMSASCHNFLDFELQAQVDDLEERIDVLQSENYDLKNQIQTGTDCRALNEKYLKDKIKKLEDDLKDKIEKGRLQLKKIRELEHASRMTSLSAVVKSEYTHTVPQSYSANTVADSTVDPLETPAQVPQSVNVEISKEVSHPATPLVSLSPPTSPHPESQLKASASGTAPSAASATIKTAETRAPVPPPPALSAAPTLIPVDISCSNLTHICVNSKDDDSVPVSYSRGSSNDPCEVLGNGHPPSVDADVIATPSPEVANVEYEISEGPSSHKGKEAQMRGNESVSGAEFKLDKSTQQDDDVDDVSMGTPLILPSGSTVPASSASFAGGYNASACVASSATSAGAAAHAKPAEKVWPKKHAGRKTNLQYVQEKLQQQKAQQQQVDTENYRKRHRESDVDEQDEEDVSYDKGESASKQPRLPTPHSERTLRELNPFEQYRAVFRTPISQSSGSGGFSAAFQTINETLNTGSGGGGRGGGEVMVDDPYAAVTAAAVARSASVASAVANCPNSSSSNVSPLVSPPPMSAGVTRTFSSNDSLGSGGSFNAYGKKKITFTTSGAGGDATEGNGQESESTAGTSSKARSKVTDPYEELVLQCASDTDSDESSKAFRKKNARKITMI